MPMRELYTLFNPKSVAIVGASSDPKKLGNIVVRNIKDSHFPGQVFPVNPKVAEVQGYKCYPNLASIKKVPDLIIISIPVEGVLSVLEDVVAIGAKNIVVFTAGFKEIGDEGKELEQALIDMAQKHGLNILGPNCLGFANTSVPINATFGKAPDKQGSLRFLSQSGAVASAIFDWAESVDLGFDEFVTLGNKTVLNECDILEYWKDKAENDLVGDFAPIGMYLESISEGKRFMELSKEISLTHPIFALKPGKSSEAKKAMQSHTGAIAGEDYVLEQAFLQSGVLRCHAIQDIFDLSMAFSWSTPPKGNRIAVVSNAGGPGVIASDLISENGMALAQLSASVKKTLSLHLPRAASLLNPIDVLGDALAERYEIAISTVLKEKEVDAVMVILTPQIMTEIKKTAEIISELSLAHKKPIVCTFIGGSQIGEGVQTLVDHTVPVFHFPERAIKALAAMWRWTSWVDANRGMPVKSNTAAVTLSAGGIDEILQEVKSEKRSALNILESNELLATYSIPVPPTQKVASFDEALGFANKHIFPVVLKVSSAGLLHKKDSGGVIVNIKDSAQLDAAFTKIKKIANSADVVIQKQVESGVEVIVGIKKDPNFGYTLMFGAGGTLTELVLDRNLHILPATKNDIINLVEKAKVAKLLHGFRGDTPYNINALISLICELVHLAENHDEIEEIEINPVIVTADGVWAVDGKVLL